MEQMRGSGVLVTVALIFLVVSLLASGARFVPTGQAGATVPTHGSSEIHSGVAVAVSPTPKAPTPLTSYHRTVMVETFTGVWCHYCPAETQALYTIDQQSSENVVAIAELHYCFSPCSSTDAFAPADGTTNSRANYYGVTGFPTVFFDGQNAVVGGNASWTWAAAQEIQKTYQKLIDNAANVPGNVSISQTATVSSAAHITDFTNITSAVTGTFNAVSYLLEWVNQLNVSNGYGPHDVGQVVRATLHNQPINLTAGETTPLVVTGTIASGWNPANLSVVTFIQDNSTHIIQNANMAPVNTLNTVVNENLTAVLANRTSTVTLHVTNTTTHAPVAGANVTLTSNAGGAFTPASGVTASDGTFSATFTAPYVTSSTSVQITAQVSHPGDREGIATTVLTVNPIILPDAPTSLVLAPGLSQVALNWSAPSSGGSGLTYHVFRASSPSGPFSEVGTSGSPGYVDAGLTGGHAYTYKVSAQNTYGFSGNTTVVTASGATASTQGLPGNIGWWITVDHQTFNSSSNGSMVVFLPNGIFTYVYGPASYAFVATGTLTPLTVSGAPFTISASFAPRYASLQGTVSPVNAGVTVNGAAVTVSSGGFAELLPAGSYTIVVSLTGYNSNTSTVVLTPGNLTPFSVVLTPEQSGSVPGASSGSGFLSTDQAVAVIAVVAVVLVVAGLVLTSKKGKRDQSP